MAKAIFDNLPLACHTLINDGNWHGGAIAKLENNLARPSATDVAVNFHLLKPILEISPERVPCLDSGVACLSPRCMHLRPAFSDLAQTVNPNLF